MNSYILLLIRIFYPKQQLTVLNGELRHHHTHTEHIAMKRDVVSEDLREDPSVLLPPVQCLMPRAHHGQHCLLLF